MLAQTLVQLILCSVGLIFLTGSISYFLKKKNEQGVYLLLTFFVLEATALLVRYCPLIYAKLKNKNGPFPPPYCLVPHEPSALYEGGKPNDAMCASYYNQPELAEYGTFRASQDSLRTSSLYQSFQADLFSNPYSARSAYDTAFLDDSKEVEFQSYSFPGTSGKPFFGLSPPRLSSFRSALSDIFPSRSSIAGIVDDPKITVL